MVVRLLCKESVAGSTPAKGSKAFFDVLKIVVFNVLCHFYGITFVHIIIKLYR